MSIWCSHPHIGTAFGEQQGGMVLSYADGFSNHYPDESGEYERPAGVALASIAPWCTPGHDQEGSNYSCTLCVTSHDAPEVGGWLRLEVAAPESLNFWGDPKKPTIEARGATVVMDVTAARALRDQINEWLAAEHLMPQAPTNGAIWNEEA